MPEIEKKSLEEVKEIINTIYCNLSLTELIQFLGLDNEVDNLIITKLNETPICELHERAQDLQTLRSK